MKGKELRTPIVMSVLTLGIAIACFVRSVPHLWMHYREEAGLQSVGTVIGASITQGTARTAAGNEPTRIWSLNLQYTYQTDRGTFSGSNDQREPIFGEEVRAKQALASVPKGTTIRVRYLPDAHRLAWVEGTQLNKGVLVLMWSICGIGLFLSIVVFFGLPGWLREARSTA